MIDIDEDYNFSDSQIWKANNILITQLGSLHYAQNVGVDIDTYLIGETVLQTETFRTHIIEQLINNNIVISSLDTEISKFVDNYLITVGEN